MSDKKVATKKADAPAGDVAEKKKVKRGRVSNPATPGRYVFSLFHLMII